MFGKLFCFRVSYRCLTLTDLISLISFLALTLINISIDNNTKSVIYYHVMKCFTLCLNFCAFLHQKLLEKPSFLNDMSLKYICDLINIYFHVDFDFCGFCGFVLSRGH